VIATEHPIIIVIIFIIIIIIITVVVFVHRSAQFLGFT